MNNRSKQKVETDLLAIIGKRQADRKIHINSMFSSLLSKYGGGDTSEPTEEEFEAAQRKLERNRSSKKSKGK